MKLSAVSIKMVVILFTLKLSVFRFVGPRHIMTHTWKKDFFLHKQSFIQHYVTQKVRKLWQSYSKKFTKLKATSITSKTRNCDITHLSNKTAYSLPQILPNLEKKLHKHFLHICMFFFNLCDDQAVSTPVFC